MSDVRIVHLYPRELGINGDSGNVLALHRRLEWRGVASEVIEVGVGEAWPANADLVVIGSGPDGARDTVLPDALRHAEALREHLDLGGGLLAVGAGMHVLARDLTDRLGVTRDGLGVLPLSVTAVDQRRVGEALGAEHAGAEGLAAVRVAGFINHGVEVRVLDAAAPLTELERGWGNSAKAREGETAAEGVRIAHAIGTHLHGPVLPMNPSLADELLRVALSRRGASLPDGDERVRHADEMARRSRAAIAGRLGRAGAAV